MNDQLSDYTNHYNGIGPLQDEWDYNESNDFCPECGNFTEFLNEFGMGLCATHAIKDSEDY